MLTIFIIKIPNSKVLAHSCIYTVGWRRTLIVHCFKTRLAHANTCTELIVITDIRQRSLTIY